MNICTSRLVSHVSSFNKWLNAVVSSITLMGVDFMDPVKSRNAWVWTYLMCRLMILMQMTMLISSFSFTFDFLV